MSKVAAAAATLTLINPDVVIEAYHAKIGSIDSWDQFVDRLKNGGLRGGKVDMVLGCVDNFEARMSVNLACNEVDQVRTHT